MNGMRELMVFLERRKPSTISFCSEDQDWFDIADPCNFRLAFKNVLIYENPNVLFLKSAESSLCISRVKKVKLKESSALVGVEIIIICESGIEPDEEIKYRFLAA